MDWKTTATKAMSGSSSYRVLVQIPWVDYPNSVTFRSVPTNLRLTAVDHSILISSHKFTPRFYDTMLRTVKLRNITNLGLNHHANYGYTRHYMNQSLVRAPGLEPGTP